MTAIRAVFDEKVFVPKQPVSLPTQCEALVLVDAVDQAEQRALDHAVRAYYQYSPDSEDEAWERAILQALPRVGMKISPHASLHLTGTAAFGLRRLVSFQTDPYPPLQGDAQDGACQIQNLEGRCRVQVAGASILLPVIVENENGPSSR